MEFSSDEFEDIVSFKNAKLAKEKGFSIGGYNCFTQYHKKFVYDGDPKHPESYKKNEVRFSDRWFQKNSEHGCDYSCKHYTNYEAPTQAVLQKWLRLKHSIFIDVTHGDKALTKYTYHVYRNWNELVDKIIQQINEEKILYSSYEEALEKALEFGLNLIK